MTSIAVEQERVAPRQGRRVSVRFVAPLVGLTVLIAIWAVGGALLAHSSQGAAFAGFAPRPALTRLVTMLVDGSLREALLPSLRRIGFGLGWAAAFGIPIGVLVGHSVLFRELTHVPFQLLRMISPLAWMPVAILTFPTWEGAIVFLIAAAAVWPIIFATANGLQKLDPDWFKLAKNLGARPWHLLTIIILPAIAQDILVGLRLALGVAWIVLVPAEYLGVTSGLGYAINDARDTLEYDRLAALIVAIGTIGFALDGVLLLAIRRVRWTQSS
ncbi:MAG: ABC transporter permease [Pseudomonadota bacterium]